MENMDELVAGCVVCHGVQEAQRGPILHGMELNGIFERSDEQVS